MKISILIGIACILFSPTKGETASSKQIYLDYLNSYPHTLGPYGNCAQGEIEIITDLGTIAQIEEVTGREVGVVAEDRYWIWFNDAVKFPNGKSGVYGRLVWRRSLEGTVGVAVMPVLPDGRIYLSRTFRHATRSWEYELPRGMVEKNETLEAAAIRETKEETGLIVGDLFFLGYMNPDSGMTNAVVPVFLAKVYRQENARPEDSEAIASIDAFSIEEIKKGFVDGYLSITHDGQQQCIHLRDPFLAFALLQSELKTHLTQKISNGE